MAAWLIPVIGLAGGTMVPKPVLGTAGTGPHLDPSGLSVSWLVPDLDPDRFVFCDGAGDVDIAKVTISKQLKDVINASRPSPTDEFDFDFKDTGGRLPDRLEEFLDTVWHKGQSHFLCDRDDGEFGHNDSPLPTMDPISIDDGFWAMGSGLQVNQDIEIYRG